jgi:tRNA-2-methylthio-N6-dimethylallyladenosine synthase
MSAKEDKTYRIETMGCQMNERDSETIAGMLEAMGYRPASGDRRSADAIVINTCSIRENADNRFFGLLGQVKGVKEENPRAVVAVCGCMMQQQHIVDRIKSKYGWVDIVFGTYNIHEFPRLFANVRDEREKIVSVWDEGGEIAEDLPSVRKHPYKAFVNITRGCNNFCSYCIVPYTRGRERSREPERILREAEALCADGVKEIMLLGQNVNAYRGEIDENGRVRECMDFSGLLRCLNEIENLARIRFMTSHPKDFSDELVRAFAEVEKLCPAVHLPLQAGSNRTLNRMNRGYTREYYLSLTEKLRRTRPDIAITTDLIVGFPGETDADFDETMDMIERVRFDSAFTFLFSPRKGTPAETYEDQVPEDVKHERFNRMAERVNAIALEKNSARVGETEEVLIEGESKTDKRILAGRAPDGKLVNLDADRSLIGQIAKAEILRANTFSFFGRICGRNKTDDI